MPQKLAILWLKSQYHGVYGEDVEAALRFLFAAMSPKSEGDFPFQGIPKMIY